MSGDEQVAPRAGSPDRASSGTTAVNCLDAASLARGILANSRDRAELTLVEARAVRSPDVDASFRIAIRFDGRPSESTGVRGTLAAVVVNLAAGARPRCRRGSGDPDTRATTGAA